MTHSRLLPDLTGGRPAFCNSLLENLIRIFCGCGSGGVKVGPASDSGGELMAMVGSGFGN